jgi:hypothetical protein
MSSQARLFKFYIFLIVFMSSQARLFKLYIFLIVFMSSQARFMGLSMHRLFNHYMHRLYVEILLLSQVKCETGNPGLNMLLNRNVVIVNIV